VAELLTEARRLAASGAVRPTVITASHLTALVTDVGTFRVTRDDGVWCCTCGLPGTCVHRLATKVAIMPRQGGLL